jgi:hypothetical protein
MRADPADVGPSPIPKAVDIVNTPFPTDFKEHNATAAPHFEGRGSRFVFAAAGLPVPISGQSVLAALVPGTCAKATSLMRFPSLQTSHGQRHRNSQDQTPGGQTAEGTGVPPRLVVRSRRKNSLRLRPPVFVVQAMGTADGLRPADRCGRSIRRLTNSQRLTLRLAWSEESG